MTDTSMNVVTEDKPVITFLTGHEKGEDSNFEGIRDKNGFEVKHMMLQTEEVPEGIGVHVFSIAPKVLGGGLFTLNQGSLLMYIVLLVIVVPVIVLAVGLTVWVRRKRRQ